MKARELRIGNIVRFEDGAETKVNGMHPSGNYIHNGKQWIEIFRFEPIPLTEEWLIKLGFKLSEIEDEDDPIFYEKTTSFDINDCPREILTISLESKECGIGYSFEGWELKFPEYVHSLQNLFYFLTGKEL